MFRGIIRITQQVEKIFKEISSEEINRIVQKIFSSNQAQIAISHSEFEDQQIESNTEKMISDVKDSIHDVQEMMTEMGLFVKNNQEFD